MTTLLVIDCSDKACSVALGNGDAIIERWTEEPRQHAKRLLPMYREVLNESGYGADKIDAIAVSAGPGSFTGLRIGFSFAQGIAFALNKPLVSISSLEALAWSCLRKNTALAGNIQEIRVSVDARMGELYNAAFKVDNNHTLVRLFEDQLISIEDYSLDIDYSYAALVGSGFALEPLSSLTAFSIEKDVCIRASDLYLLALERFNTGQGKTAVGAEPIYLRRENAWKTIEQQIAHRNAINATKGKTS